MADTARAEKFGTALQQLEQSGDPQELVAQFADGAQLQRAELAHHEPTSDATQFWSTYRDQFSDIDTEFTHLAEEGSIAVLEWTSQATLSTGRSIRYAGVSLLTFGDDDRVTRFATYYDTAAFVTPAT